jgi:hypothetical protein
MKTQSNLKEEEAVSQAVLPIETEAIPEAQTEADQWIDIQPFIDRMEDHWINELGNVSSDALRKTWGQICYFFQKHIQNHETPDNKKWYILSPPTGSGKTESAIIYASMLSELSNEDHPGMLIVTRLRADCERIANRINSFGSRRTAVAHHAESDTVLKELSEHPVLVITHKAYELAIGFLGLEGKAELQSKWTFFRHWDKGRSDWDEFTAPGRKLIVIDECIDLVDDAQVTGSYHLVIDGFNECS